MRRALLAILLLLCFATEAGAVEIQKGDQLFFDYLQVGQAPGQGWRIYTDQQGNLNFQDSLGTHGINFQGASLLNTTFPTPTLASPTITGTVSGGADFSTGTVTPTGGTGARTQAQMAADWINVKNGYGGNAGAYGDTAIVTADGAVSSGSTAFTTTTTTFTAADVGKEIDIAGAGNATFTPVQSLLTTISAYVGPHAVTLAAAATTTVSGASFLYGHNDQAALNAAFAQAASIQGTAFLPAGIYLVDTNSGLVTLKSNMTIRGAGIGRTIIVCDDDGRIGLGGAGCLAGAGGTPSTTPLANLTFRDVTVRGTVDLNPVTNFQTAIAGVAGGSVLFQVAEKLSGNQFICSNIVVERSEFTLGRYFGVALNGCDGVVFRDNHVSKIARDGVDTWGSTNASITGNRFENVNDDAIAFDPQNASYASTAPLPAAAIIAHNRVVESQGIRVLGGKQVRIEDNVFDRTLGPCLYAYNVGTGTIGNTPEFAVTFHGNICIDTFTRADAAPYNRDATYLTIGGAPNASLTPSFGSTGTPGTYYTAATPPTAVGKSGFFDISDNLIMRTRPAQSVGYSDWGYNPSGLWECVWANSPTDTVLNCGYSNVAIPEANLEQIGININGPLAHSRIAGNKIATSSAAVELSPNVTFANGDLDALQIENNDLSDCIGANACIFGNPGALYERISIVGNHFDADPRFASSNRGTNGTWATSGGPFGVQLASVIGVRIERNSFRNLTNPIQSAGIGFIKDNVLYGNPAQTGFSTSNVGIGVAPVASLAYRWVIEDDNPNSATYQEQLFDAPTTATAEPASGFFVQGTFISNSGNASSLIFGWFRLTTGSGNVDGTDWKTVYMPLSGVSGSIGGGALAGGACASGTVSITGATTSMVATADPNTYPGDGAEWQAYVSAAGTVTVKVCALVALTPTASTYNVRVLQ